MMASEILADAYFRQGYQVQSFPSFGVERRGAPVTAFLRVSKEFIYIRSMIYQAEIGLVFSADIVNAPTFKPSLREGATLLINSDRRLQGLNGFEVSYIDATSIALEYGLGSSAQPLVNTAMLGAFAKVARDLQLDHLLEAVKDKVPQNAKKNLAAVEKAYRSVVGFE